MSNDQASLATNFGAFIQAMAGVGADWQVGVITTSSRLLRGPIITSGLNAASQFSTQVSVGTGGLPFEEGIERAYEATQPGADAGPGSPNGFPRTGAMLSILFVSDQVDPTDTSTPVLTHNYRVALKGGIPGKLVVNGIITMLPNDGCGTSRTARA